VLRKGENGGHKKWWWVTIHTRNPSPSLKLLRHATLVPRGRFSSLSPLRRPIHFPLDPVQAVNSSTLGSSWDHPTPLQLHSAGISRGHCWPPSRCTHNQTDHPSQFLLNWLWGMPGTTQTLRSRRCRSGLYWCAGLFPQLDTFATQRDSQVCNTALCSVLPQR